ncbi:MAG: bifunctional phosphopantothenoylcysteine decarboxylase/phosphopantothenate--cysteine ligase CoaBC, partial [Desulfocapsa sp.]
AGRFVTPLSFAALSGNPVLTDMFQSEESHAISHIELGQKADVLLVAPATANSIAKFAHGLADDLLSTTLLAADCPVLIAPAMNSRMYENPITQRNIALLVGGGYSIIKPGYGKMACKSEGLGRLAEWEDAEEQILQALAEQDLQGQKILITAGPTREPLDPARFLSNRSSGKMGYALARAAARRGADVHLISGPTSLPAPCGVQRTDVITAEEMYREVMQACTDCSVIIKAAAVSDFRPCVSAEQKVKKENADFVLQLEQTDDILQELGRRKEKHKYLLVGFAAESCKHRQAGEKKLKNKNLDLIAINDISKSDTGFEANTNQVTLLDHTGFTDLPLTSKEETANLILDRISSRLLSNC